MNRFNLATRLDNETIEKGTVMSKEMDDFDARGQVINRPRGRNKNDKEEALGVCVEALRVVMVDRNWEGVKALEVKLAQLQDEWKEKSKSDEFSDLDTWQIVRSVRDMLRDSFLFVGEI